MVAVSCAFLSYLSDDVKKLVMIGDALASIVPGVANSHAENFVFLWERYAVDWRRACCFLTTRTLA